MRAGNENYYFVTYEKLNPLLTGDLHSVYRAVASHPFISGTARSIIILAASGRCGCNQFTCCFLSAFSQSVSFAPLPQFTLGD